jgi:hypothetical protein
MIEDVARLSVVQQPAVMGTCDLCATPGVEMSHAVVVRHHRGGTVTFGACQRCVGAVRRLSAAFGGQGRFVAEVEPEVVTRTAPDPGRTVGYPELMLELTTLVRDQDGIDYTVQVWGQGRADGTWIGWLEFVSVVSGERLRTDVETTQSNREGVAYWATGLQPTYLSGAFPRARVV